MNQPDFEGARDFALMRLARELPPALGYHSLSHTRDEVVPAVERLAAGEGMDERALVLLRTAAYFHDIGFVRQWREHEIAGASIAAQVLPRYGYTVPQIAQIRGMIMATRLPQVPYNALEALLADADLDVLGREDFFARNAVLRAELAACGIITTDEQWLSDQLQFLEQHHYFTATAEALRGARKRENVARLRQLRDRCRLNGRAYDP